MPPRGRTAAAASPSSMAVPDSRAESRRHRIGSASSRSLLLTVLGEFALPHGQPVWTGALVGALAELGVEEKAARQALARTASEGLLAAERDGRRVRWSLTEPGRRLLEDGAERIYAFMREAPRWDDQWLVLAVTVPESQRQLRHRLRTRLTWAGLGSPLPGLWVTPHADKEKEVAIAVADLGVEAFSYIGHFGVIGEERRVVAAAWSLDEVAADYDQFLHRFTSEEPAGQQAAFHSQVALVHSWRRFPFVDPALPAELLPRTWPGPRSAELFRRRHGEWHRPAQAHWSSLCQDADRRS